MVEVLSESEDQPSSYPAAPADLSTAAAAIDSAALWQRIESWIAHRWQEREVTWIINGPGVWVPRLRPYSNVQFEVWADADWSPTTVTAAPLGFELDARTYRATATVGATDTPPAAVLEAYRRLAEFLSDDSDLGRVASSGSRSLGDALSWEATRPAAWQAKALQFSGAGDLLRRYRRC